MNCRFVVWRAVVVVHQLYLVMFICITKFSILHLEEAVVQFFLHMDRLLEQRFLPQTVQKLVIFTFGPSIEDALIIYKLKNECTVAAYVQVEGTKYIKGHVFLLSTYD